MDVSPALEGGGGELVAVRCPRSRAAAAARDCFVRAGRRRRPREREIRRRPLCTVHAARSSCKRHRACTALYSIGCDRGGQPPTRRQPGVWRSGRRWPAAQSDGRCMAGARWPRWPGTSVGCS